MSHIRHSHLGVVCNNVCIAPTIATQSKKWPYLHCEIQVVSYLGLLVRHLNICQASNAFGPMLYMHMVSQELEILNIECVKQEPAIAYAAS